MQRQCQSLRKGLGMGEWKAVNGPNEGRRDDIMHYEWMENGRGTSKARWWMLLPRATLRLVELGKRRIEPECISSSFFHNCIGKAFEYRQL